MLVLEKCTCFSIFIKRLFDIDVPGKQGISKSGMSTEKVVGSPFYTSKYYFSYCRHGCFLSKYTTSNWSGST